MQTYQHLAIDGPLDGRIVTTAESVDMLTQDGWAGHYRRVTMSSNVRVFMWFSKRDRWAKRLRNVRWGVPKRPFGVVESSR